MKLLTEKQCAVLRQLVAGERVPFSKLNREWVEELQKEGLLTCMAQGSRRTLCAVDTLALDRYLSGCDDRYRALSAGISDTDEVLTRADLAVETGNSKWKRLRSCPGFPVNAYDPIPARLNGCDIQVLPTPGSFLFIADWQSFEIPEDVVVVGIENMENFRLVCEQRSFFTRYFGDVPLLFVSRYPQSTDLREWLLRLPNRYVHFGDFDLAGIRIFLTEFRCHLGERATFLLPEDIVERLRNKGSSERYNEQYKEFQYLTSDIPELQHLIDQINILRRCYDQEGYTKNK